jgi:hypothetical protein
MELETDERGIVTFLPLINWGVSLVQGATVGLALDYYASAEDAAARRLTRLQVHLDPGGAQAMARSLQTRADLLPGAAPPGRA